MAAITQKTVYVLQTPVLFRIEVEVERYIADHLSVDKTHIEEIEGNLLTERVTLLGYAVISGGKTALMVAVYLMARFADRYFGRSWHHVVWENILGTHFDSFTRCAVGVLSPNHALRKAQHIITAENSLSENGVVTQRLELTFTVGVERLQWGTQYAGQKSWADKLRLRGPLLPLQEQRL
jgi:hypothetical protein